MGAPSAEGGCLCGAVRYRAVVSSYRAGFGYQAP